MSHRRKKILGSLFNPLAQLGGRHPIELDHLYDLFADYGADPAHQDIETLKKAVGKAIKDFFELSKYINCSRSENLFMQEFIELGIAIGEVNPTWNWGYIYPDRDTISELYNQRDGYLAMAFHSKYLDADSMDMAARIRKTQATTNLQKLHQRFEEFFERTNVKEMSQSDIKSYDQNVPAERIWDLWLLKEGQVKIEVESIAILVHSLNTYDADPFVRKQNIRDALDRVIEWVETYGEASPALSEINLAFVNIQQALSLEEGFYDPRYVVIDESAIFKLDEHANIFTDIAEIISSKKDRVGDMPPAGETFQSVADKLKHFGMTIPSVAGRSILTSHVRPPFTI